MNTTKLQFLSQSCNYRIVDVSELEVDEGGNFLGHEFYNELDNYQKTDEFDEPDFVTFLSQKK